MSNGKKANWNEIREALCIFFILFILIGGSISLILILMEDEPEK